MLSLLSMLPRQGEAEGTSSFLVWHPIWVCTRNCVQSNPARAESGACFCDISPALRLYT